VGSDLDLTTEPTEPRFVRIDGQRFPFREQTEISTIQCVRAGTLATRMRAIVEADDDSEKAEKQFVEAFVAFCRIVVPDAPLPVIEKLPAALKMRLVSFFFRWEGQAATRSSTPSPASSASMAGPTSASG
jgi:hypothetical protein